MPEGTITFVVNTTLERVWDFMADPKLHTHCIPGCVSCEITGPDTNLWIMDLELGPFIKRLEVKSRNVEINPPRSGKWEGQTEGAKIIVEMQLADNGESSTLITYRLGIEPKSFLLRSMGQLIKEKLDRDVKIYAKNLKETLESAT
ncbi:MAG TPA: SRPBCC family protein [Candidatus Methanoperedenaceae archaeon]|nr:SRPBCC family protein [Candidatus Methanoperedenaceae archaeon]